MTTARINRRTLLAHSGAAVLSSTVRAACAAKGARRDLVMTDKLQALIEAHITAYAAFGKAMHEMDGSSGDDERASREEERTLLAICAYPAVSGGDRLAKARYLLEIEARGELDLPEHIQALLRSTISDI